MFQFQPKVYSFFVAFNLIHVTSEFQEVSNSNGGAGDLLIGIYFWDIFGCWNDVEENHEYSSAWRWE